MKSNEFIAEAASDSAAEFLGGLQAGLGKTLGLKGVQASGNLRKGAAQERQNIAKYTDDAINSWAAQLERIKQGGMPQIEGDPATYAKHLNLFLQKWINSEEPMVGTLTSTKAGDVRAFINQQVANAIAKKNAATAATTAPAAKPAAPRTAGAMPVYDPATSHADELSLAPTDPAEPSDEDFSNPILNDFTVDSNEPLIVRYNKRRFSLGSSKQYAGEWINFGSSPEKPVTDQNLIVLLDKFVRMKTGDAEFGKDRKPKTTASPTPPPPTAEKTDATEVDTPVISLKDTKTGQEYDKRKDGNWYTYPDGQLVSNKNIINNLRTAEYNISQSKKEKDKETGLELDPKDDNTSSEDPVTGTGAIASGVNDAEDAQPYTSPENPAVFKSNRKAGQTHTNPDSGTK